jgi:hypothetical protein
MKFYCGKLFPETTVKNRPAKEFEILYLSFQISFQIIKLLNILNPFEKTN